jgi:RimJ/RimL family protein N-acetyltransferase
MQENNFPDWFASVGIRGNKVALEPLTIRHELDLAAAGRDPAIWRWLPAAHHMPGSMRDFIEHANEAVAEKSAVVFATIDFITQKAIGSTRYHHIVPEHRRLEIGVTWLATEFQQSHVNTEAKYLQLWYAFEKLKCRRVELKADVQNLKSRAAILRLGATEEGIFRKHMLYADGRNRDNVYFSIIDDDWPLVRERLQQKLGYVVEPKISKSCHTASSFDR